MAPRIRVIYEKRVPSFAERLELRARSLVRDRSSQDASSLTSSSLEQQIAFTLGQLDQTRWAHEEARRDLTQQEIYVETEIIQREPRVPPYEDPRLPERDMLRGRLLRLGVERRQLILAESEATQRLQEKLLELMLRSDLVLASVHSGNVHKPKRLRSPST